MKISDLNPTWVGAGGEGISDKDGNPVPERHGVGIIFDCPCKIKGGDRCAADGYVAFANPIDGGPPCISPGEPTWTRTGETFETLTLTPSIQRTAGSCGWHGYFRNGEVLTV